MIVHCPKCGNLVSDKATVCPSCGASVMFTAEDEAAKEVKPQQSSTDEFDYAAKRKPKLGVFIMFASLSLILFGVTGFVMWRNLFGVSMIEMVNEKDEPESLAEPENVGDVKESILEEKAVLSRAESAFYQIPDHAKVSEKAKIYMTEDLYETLMAAWDVPQWVQGIGDEEFLSYFITGNDPSDKQEVKSSEVVSSQDGRYSINVKYLETWGMEPAENLSEISLEMVSENDKWVVDDFGNGVKNCCKEYIRKEVDDFMSGEITRCMKNEMYEDSYISDVEQAFKEYISKYSRYLNAILR